MPVAPMPMEFNCTACRRPLSVADDYEGTQVKCPQCGVVLPVPRIAEINTADTGSPRWSVRIPEGKVYGPIEQDELDRWIDEGRIDGDCMLQAEGEEMWKLAAMVIPRLDVPPRTTRSFINPAAVGSRPGGASTAYVAAHRGGLLLTFGILGIVFALSCVLAPLSVFSPIAWWMSQKDMRAIRDGRMDRDGEGLTQAGLILGIIGTMLFSLYVLFAFVQIALLVFAVVQGRGGPMGGGPGPGGF